MNGEITTIKIDRRTKARMESLRSYKRESYDDIVQKMLEVLSICRFSPEKSQARLIQIEKERKNNLHLVAEKVSQNSFDRPEISRIKEEVIDKKSLIKIPRKISLNFGRRR